MSKYYIASPFFNDEQNEYVESLENLLIITGNEYYSPRKCGDTKNLEVPEYMNDLKRKLIFKSNINAIDSCDSMIVNLIHKDMGTLFEFGIACGKILLGDRFDITTVPDIKLNFNKDYYKNVISKLTVIIKKDDDYQTILNQFKDVKVDAFDNHPEIIVISTDAGDNYFMASFALGLGYKLGNTKYISPVKSFSNLMITESGIKQYLNIEDLDNNNPVVYSDEQIR